jgi:hypothetical protein
MPSRPICALALALLLAPAVARAQDGDARAESRVFFTSGVQALDDGRPGDALLLFQRAYDAFPHFSTLYNIALCQRALGRPAAAANSLRKYLDDGGDAIPERQRASATTLLAEMDAKVAVVTVRTAPHAKVSVDGKPIAGVATRLEPGAHELSATADGRAPAKRTINVHAGEHGTIELDMPPATPASGAEAKPPAPATPPAPAPEPEEEHPSRFNAAFWAATGISAVTLGLGVFSGAVALGDSNAYHDPNVSDADAERRKSRGEVLRVVADSSFGVSLAGAAAAVLIATRSMDPPRSHAWKLAPAVGPRVVGLALAITP